MAGVRIEGDLGALIKRLNQLSNVDFRGINAVLAETLRTSTIDRFREEKDPKGKKWKTSIRVQEEGGKILSQNATLRNSIHSEFSEKGFEIGTNSIYAATHQFGDERTIRANGKKALKFQYDGKWHVVKSVKVNIPKRAFLGISQEDMREIRAMLKDFISGE